MIISICIPTYNRDVKLYKQLSIFYDQLKSLNYKYELIVSDNKSSDKTLAVIKKYKRKFSKLKNVSFVVNINKFNKGFTKNLIKTIDLASGQYSLFLSDDDFPKKIFTKSFMNISQLKSQKD